MECKTKKFSFQIKPKNSRVTGTKAGYGESIVKIQLLFSTAIFNIFEYFFFRNDTFTFRGLWFFSTFWKFFWLCPPSRVGVELCNFIQPCLHVKYFKNVNLNWLHVYTGGETLFEKNCAAVQLNYLWINFLFQYIGRRFMDAEKIVEHENCKCISNNQ